MCQIMVVLCYLFIQEKQVDLSLKMKEKVSTPEGVPRLFDLIKVRDERMKLAFYAAMGNTLVAKDLDQVAFIFHMQKLCVLNGMCYLWHTFSCIPR